MAFDTLDHRDSAFVFPLEYHPASPMTGEVLAKALQTAFYQARYGNRIVFQQCYEANHAQPNVRNSQGGGVIFQNAYVRIAEGYAHVPEEVTHLRASVLYGIAPFNAPTVRHKITATDGTTTVSVEANPFRVTQWRISNQGVTWDPDSVASNDRQFEEELLLDVSTLTAGADWNIYVEGYAKYDGNNSAMAYKPFHVSVSWEVIG